MLTLLASLLALGLQTSAQPPALGSKAPIFDVKTLDEKSVKLDQLLQKGPVVLVVLRGYPGYQCPFCTKQVADLISRSTDFVKRKSEVVLVYPGPSEGLKRYAGEFIAGKDIPVNFKFTVDPGYAFTQSYGLRWDAPKETAYPSTFVIAPDGYIAYEKISHTHGDRAPVDEVLSAIDQLAVKN